MLVMFPETVDSVCFDVSLPIVDKTVGVVPLF